MHVYLCVQQRLSIKIPKILSLLVSNIVNAIINIMFTNFYKRQKWFYQHYVCHISITAKNAVINIMFAIFL